MAYIKIATRNHTPGTIRSLMYVRRYVYPVQSGVNFGIRSCIPSTIRSLIFSRHVLRVCLTRCTIMYIYMILTVVCDNGTISPISTGCVSGYLSPSVVLHIQPRHVTCRSCTISFSTMTTVHHQYYFIK